MFIAFPPSPPGFALHFVIFAADANIALILVRSAVLFCDSNSFSHSYKNFKFIISIEDKRVTSVIHTYDGTPYFCSTLSGSHRLAPTFYLIS
jgi:hypothetical protein